VQPRFGKKAHVLEVALAPAAVALVELLERLGRAFGAAALRDVELDMPARAADPGRLDEVVAED
jgi:hypothetical protein